MEPMFTRTWEEFEESVVTNLKGTPGIAGLVFMRPGQNLADKEIQPHLEYFHKISLGDIYFYFPGWTDVKETYKSGMTLGHWEFDVDNFIHARNLFPKHFDWQYSGGVDLLLFSVCKDVN